MSNSSSMEQLKHLQLEYECAKKELDVAQKRIEELEDHLENSKKSYPLINGKPCDLNAVLDTVSIKAKQSKKKVGKLIVEAITNF